MKLVDELIKQSGAWLDATGKIGVIVSSRLRLARNLAGVSFPGWAGEEEVMRVWGQAVEVLQSRPSLPDSLVLALPDLGRVDKEVLLERHLISREMTERGAGSGLVASRDETMAVMVNEEDHLRLQAMKPGLELAALWERLNRLDTEIEQTLDYAFSPTLGYLTACPSNVGTGMRASVMLHLPGLVLMNEIAPIIKAVNKIGLAVRGLWGEGTEAAGNMFQISNQMTLGENEENLIRRLEQIVLEITEHEQNARSRLAEQKVHSLRDHVGRAYGILTHAFLLNSKETLDLLSALRLGIEMGIVTEWSESVVNDLFLRIQPGHLQKAEGKTIGAERRDLVRARHVRDRLALTRRQNPGEH